MKKILLITSVFCLLCCTQSNKDLIKKVKIAHKNFSKIKKKHNVQSDILIVLEHFSKLETFKTEKANSTITLVDGDFGLTFKNNALTNVKNSETIYKIKDVNTIDIQYYKGEGRRGGSLKAGIYDGIYITKTKDEILKEVHLVKGDSILLKETYKNGSLKRKVKYNTGLRDGIYTEFYRNKTKKIECQYSNGLKEGIYQEWFDTGKQKTKILYKKGKKEGEQKIYYRDTQTMQLKTFYKSGSKEGFEIAWYKNTKPKYKVFYKKGKLEGEAILYQEDKELMKMKGSYVDDLRSGNFVIWNQDGQVIFSANYEYGELLKILAGNNEGDNSLYDLEDIFY